MIQVIKEPKDSLSLLMIIQQVITSFCWFFQKTFFPRVKIENYNIEINGINFYDQPINDLIKQCNKVTKVSTGQGDDYTYVVYWLLLILKKLTE